MTIAQLVQAMEEPATEDLRGDQVLPILLKAIGTPKSAKLKSALATLKRGWSTGAHRRDLDRDGDDEETPAIELMDAWWPKLVASASSNRRSGANAYERLAGHAAKPASYTGGSPDEPNFYDGWWGYVSKDLRDIFGPKPRRRLEPQVLRRRVEGEVPGDAGAEPDGGAHR